jgi:multidrug efflux pump subunit AcrA (membrane-fusion protein)
VVQSTVSGTGNVEPSTELDLGFKTAGVVSRILVHQGEQVARGQLLAEVDPKSAEVTLQQAKASLQAAEATLAQEEESGGETSGGGGSSAGGGSSGRGTGTATAASNSGTATTTSNEEPAKGTQPGSGSAGGGEDATNGQDSRKPSVAAETTPTSTKSPESAETTPTSTTSEKPKQSAATREANLASTRAGVSSDRLAVQSAEEALADTRLYAPSDGTIVSLSGEVGEAVSATGTTNANASGSGSSGSGLGSGAGAGGSGRSGSGSSSGGSSGSGTSFAVLANLQSMQVVAPLSESEVVHVHDGQPATVSVEALEGAKLAAHVTSVASLATSNSGVVSYDVTFTLDQLTSGLRSGMSASAEVVVKQEEGVSVPSSAISAGSVTVVRGGKHVSQPVVTGLAGNSSTIVLSGLSAGEQVVLPLARSSSGSSSLLSRLGSRGGGLGGGGGALGAGPIGGGGGGAVFFRGGGG